jgi:MFS family permease
MQDGNGTMATSSPRWYYGWNIIGTGMTFQAVLFGLTFFSFTYWAPIWAEEFDVPLTMVMWANVGMMVAQGVISPFIGHAMDSRSIKWLISLGAVSASLGFVAVSQATEVWHIIVIYSTFIPMGVLLAGPLAAQTLAAKWFTARRGFAIGISTTGTSIGGFILPILVGALFLDYGWRTTHLVLAVLIVAIVIPVVWTFVANKPEDKGIELEAEAEIHEDAGPPHVYPSWTTRSILSQRNFWVIILAFVPLMTAQGAIQANLVPYALDLGTSRELTPNLISIMAVTMIGGKLFFGRQADRWDHRYLFLIAVVLIGITLGLMLLEPDYTMQLVIAGILGVGTGAFLPLLGAIISSRFGPAGFGKVMGLLGPFTTTSALGTIFAARVYDNNGNYDFALQVFLIVIIPAAIMVLLLKPKPGDEKAPAKATATAGE